MPDKTETPWSDWSDENSKAIEAAEAASEIAPAEQGAHEARCSVAAGSASSRVTPFYCGTQRMDWKCYNCDFCTKRYDESKRDWPCDLEKKIDEAYMDDGSVDESTAARMAVPQDCTVHNWRCGEFVEDTQERARVAEARRAREAAQRAYENRNRPAPWIEAWQAGKPNTKGQP